MTAPASRKEEIRAKIRELSECMEKLEAELEAEAEREQHDAIDRLEEYFNAVETRFQGLREYWKVVYDEIRGPLSNSK